MNTAPWRLKRTAQCEKCPWRVDVDAHSIPNGYCENKHRALAETIAPPDVTMESYLKAVQQTAVHVMACHETEDAHCVGWLSNQLGPGNNIALRLRMRSCENAGKLRLRGEQHASFADTLPGAR